LKLEEWNVGNLLKGIESRINSIPGTTGPGIPQAVRKMLNNSYGGVNESVTDTYGAAEGKLSVSYTVFNILFFICSGCQVRKRLWLEFEHIELSAPRMHWAVPF
jgi:hypothetical protein